MKKLIVSLMTILSVLGLATPATAAEPASVLSCAEGTGDSNNNRIHDLLIWYKYEIGVGCTVSHFVADGWNKNYKDYGRWQLWGPRGWTAQDQNVKQFRESRFLTEVHRTTYTGDLWCARFVKDWDGSVLTEGCVTATPYS